MSDYNHASDELLALAKTQGLTVRIVQDEYPESPREWDNLGTLVLRNYKSDEDFETDRIVESVTGNLEYDLMLSHAKSKDLNINDIIFKPVYAYVHSGETFATTPFSCRWDSGLYGVIYVTKQKVRKEYGVKRISKALTEKVLNILEGEIKDYDTWARGEVYGFVIEKDDEQLDSCWGYYSLEQVEAEVKSLIVGY